MTRRRQTTQLVPVEPAHRRTWQSMWRRCSCGLPTPCVDRLLPASLPPFPPRARSRRTTFGPHPRITPTRPSPGPPQLRRAPQPSVPLPQRRRPSPPQPIPTQDRRTTKDRFPVSLRHSAPGGSRAQSAGSGGPPVSLSPRSSGDGTPMRRPPPPGSYLPGQRSRPATQHEVTSPTADGSCDLGGRNSIQSHGRPGPYPGRPAMADRQINLHHW
jgi:hypothetical protein